MISSMLFPLVLAFTHLQLHALASVPSASDCKTSACTSQIDDALAMIQRNAKVSLDGQMATEDAISLADFAGVGNLLQVGGVERLTVAEKMESSMESAVMKMIDGKERPTLPAEIIESIFTQMELIRKQLVGEKDGFQAEITAANEAVAQCNTNMHDTSSGAVVTAKDHADNSKSTHNTCREAELSAYNAKNASCTLLASMTNNIGNAAPQCNCDLSTLDTSAVLSCLASNRNWVNSARGVHEGFSLLESHENDLAEQREDCTNKTTTWSNKATVCDTNQVNYELAFCTYAETIENMCSTLDTCYNGAIEFRTSTEASVRIEEKHIKAVLASAKKIICFLSILNKSSTENLTMSDFEACKNMDVHSDTTYLSNSVPDLNITYPPADAKATCQTLTTTPGDDHWAAAEYANYTQEWLRETLVCSHKTTAVPSTTPAF